MLRRRMRSMLLLGAALAALAWTPTALADCTYTEVLFVEGVATVQIFECDDANTWTYGPACHSVPLVRVAGQTVPGTGTDHCAGSGSETFPWTYYGVSVNGDDVWPVVGPGYTCNVGDTLVVVTCQWT